MGASTERPGSHTGEPTGRVSGRGGGGTEEGGPQLGPPASGPEAGGPGCGGRSSGGSTKVGLGVGPILETSRGGVKHRPATIPPDMRIGLALPHYELSFPGGAPLSWANLADAARRAEAVG